MATIIRAPDAAFTNFVDVLGWRPPYKDDCLFACLAGRTSDETRLNVITGGLATEIGSMVIGTNKATLSMTNGMNTGINVGRPFSYVVAALVTTNAGLVGQWPAGAPDLLHTSGTGLALAVSGLATGTTLSTAVQASPALYVGTYDGTTARTYVHTGSALRTASAARGTTGAATDMLKIGGTTYGAGTFEFYGAAVYDAALNETQILAVRASFQEVLAERGVSLL